MPAPLTGPPAAARPGPGRLPPRRLPLSGDVLRFGSRFIYADNGRAVSGLGFTATPLRETLERAVAWLREEKASLS